MQIKDKLDFQSKPDPITFAPEDKIQAALDVMCEKNIGSIVVVNPDRTVAGIVTERDMMIRVLGAGVNPKKIPLSDIMSTEVSVAYENDELVDWLRTMSHERFRHLPIVDADGKLISMLSQGDFVAFTWPDLYEKVKQDLKGRLGKLLQVSLVLFAIITLALIGLKL